MLFKTLVFITALMSPVFAMAFCPLPTFVVVATISDQQQNQQAQQAFMQCMDNERQQQEQMRLQQEQMQQEQLRLQQQQMQQR
jgi:hypothetical protein